MGGETQRNLSIEIVDDMEFERDEKFEVELYEVTNNAKLGKTTKTAVTITNDDDFNGIMNKLMSMTNANVDELRVHNDTWASNSRMLWLSTVVMLRMQQLQITLCICSLLDSS